MVEGKEVETREDIRGECGRAGRVCYLHLPTPLTMERRHRSGREAVRNLEHGLAARRARAFDVEPRGR